MSWSQTSFLTSLTRLRSRSVSDSRCLSQAEGMGWAGNWTQPASRGGVLGEEEDSRMLGRAERWGCAAGTFRARSRADGTPNDAVLKALKSLVVFPSAEGRRIARHDPVVDHLYRHGAWLHSLQGQARGKRVADDAIASLMCGPRGVCGYAQ